VSGMVKAEIWRAGGLCETDRLAMEALYRRYYEGAPAEAFRRDLEGKDRAIILREGGVVVGFSTMKSLDAAGRKVLFSGDTVVDVACRNQTGLAGAFGHVMRRLNEEFAEAPDWFLICKGARTYRFLPTFFRRYVPGRREDSELSARLAAIARAVYPREYDEATGVLHFGEGKDRLKGDALRMDAESMRFRALNPGWTRGDELCCLAPLSMDNLNRLGLRVIADVSPEWHE